MVAHNPLLAHRSEAGVDGVEATEMRPNRAKGPSVLETRTPVKAFWAALAMAVVAALAWGGMTAPQALAAADGSVTGTVLTETGDPYTGFVPETGSVDRVVLLQRGGGAGGTWAW